MYIDNTVQRMYLSQMFRIIALLAICFNLSCNGDQSLKEKELELKERDLNLRERELDSRQKRTEVSTKTVKKERRRLRYLYYANGGLIGFFNDGSVAGCPRCDLMRENVKALYSIDPHAKYTVSGNEILFDGDVMSLLEKNGAGSGWAMKDYKWFVDL